MSRIFFLVYYSRVYNQGQTKGNNTTIKNDIIKIFSKIKIFITEIFENINDNEIELLHDLSKKFQKDLPQMPDILTV